MHVLIYCLLLLWREEGKPSADFPVPDYLEGEKGL